MPVRHPRPWNRTFAFGSQSLGKLRIERLEDRSLPSVSFVFDTNLGKNVVSFDYSASSTNDQIILRRGSGGQLEYGLNGAAFSSDLDTSTAGNQPLFLSVIGDIQIALGSGDDSQILNTSNGSVHPSPNGITFAGGDGIDSVIAAENSNFTLTDTSLAVASGGKVYLASVERAELTGGNSANHIDASAFYAGDVVLNGGEGDDTLLGGAGDDQLIGNNGADVMDGGAGNDLLDGDNGDDDMFGGAGDDQLLGGDNGADFMDGGAGNDLVEGGRGDDTCHGGVGFDTITATGNRNFVLTDSTLYSTGNGTDQLISIEGAELNGGTSDNLMDASAFTGSTMLNGGGGDDTLIGGSGTNNYVQSKGQTLVVTGGAGDDTYIVAFGGSLQIIEQGGNDAVNFDALSAAVTFSLDVVDGTTQDIDGLGTKVKMTGKFENIVGTAFGDKLTGNSADNVIYGGRGNDVLMGGDGDDLLFGGTNGTTGDTEGGDDILFGGPGRDRLDGGEGDDILFGGTSGGTGDTDGSDDIMFGGPGHDRLEGGGGDDILFGGTGSGTADDDIQSDILFGGPGRDQIDGGRGDDILFGGTGAGMIDEDENGDILFGGPGRDHLDGGEGDDILFGGTAPSGSDSEDGPGDILFGWNGNDLLSGDSGDDLFDGGAGDDQYHFVGINLGSDSITESDNVDTDTLNFAGFAAAIALDLAITDPQVISAQHLTLTLSSSTAIENVVGSRFADVVFGNSRDNDLRGANQFDDRVGNAASWNGTTQVVYLDFDSYTDAGEHAYSAAERSEIQSRMEIDYAGFHVAFTQTAPSGDFATVYFNRSPIVNGQPVPGGISSELDFRNVNLGGTAFVQVNGLLGGPGQPDDNTANFIGLSATIGAHELGHLLGLRHLDSVGPIGYGIPKTLDDDDFLPAYPGPNSAFETFLHLIASPASVGESLTDAASDQFFGEREAIKLAFNVSGTNVSEQALSHATRSTAQKINLTNLAVPNTLVSGLRWSQDFAASAVSVSGSVGLVGGVSEDDYYSFVGRAGDLMTFEIYSTGLDRIANPIDSVLRLYDANGNLVPYYGSTAENDDNFEGQDAILLDVVLPADGVFYVLVDTFTSTAVPDNDTGNYELFIHRFAAGHATDAGDMLDGRNGDDVLSAGLGANQLFGGDGYDTVKDNANIAFALTNSSLTGSGTNTLLGIENAIIVASDEANIINVAGWSGSSTIIGRDGLDTLIGPDSANTWSIVGSNAGTLNGQLSFSQIESLVGGTGADQFIFAEGAALTVGVDGRDNVDIVDMAASTSSLTWNILGTGAGTVAGYSFAGVESLLGGLANDEFVISVGVTPSLTVSGGSGLDTLNYSAGSLALTWLLTTIDMGTVGTINFTSVENAVGSLDDDFVLLFNGAGLTGTFIAGLGRNWLDYTAYTTGVTVNLQTNLATGFGGIAGFANVSGGSGVDLLTGSSADNIFVGNGGADSLDGSDGRDILIGGFGADLVDGGADDDIIIGVRTSSDGNRLGLLAIMLEWSRTDADYTTRINHIRGIVPGGLNGSNLLTLSNVASDAGAVDTLFGRTGFDWFFYENNDLLMDQSNDEIALLLPQMKVGLVRTSQFAQ